MKKYFLLFSVSVFAIIGLAACNKGSDAASQAAIDDSKIQAYIQANNVTGLTKDPTGYYYKIIITGTGKAPISTDTVKASYTGTYLYGTNFSSEASVISVLSNSVPGYQYALERIAPGGRIYFILPSALGYGTAGSPDGNIPPNTCLIFTVDLLGYY